jgi:hypothetical protein
MRTTVVQGVAVLVLAGLLSPAARAAQGIDPGTALSGLSGDPTAALAGELRSLVVQFVPSPLFEDHSHWGQQREVVRGLVWRGSGLRIHAQPQKSLKNDGLWWRVKVDAPNLRNSLVLDLRDVHSPEPGRLLFTAFISFDTEINYDRERWRAGLRTWAGSIRARARVKLTLRCEVLSRLEAKGKGLPDVVFRMRVVGSDFQYDNLKVEHLAGLGGDLAEILGEALHSGINQWRPSLERNLIAKANAAIVKGADTKEVRISLSRLLGK